jgi:hypothetical protein
MVSRAEPVVYPCRPELLFDALVAHFPDTDQQVLWADRQLGMISGLSGRMHRYGHIDRFSIYLRPGPDEQTVVSVHVDRHKKWGDSDPVEPVSAHVADVAARVCKPH